MPESPQNDVELMRALQAGDERSLPLLIERWEKPLYNFAYRYIQNHQTSRDIVEETIVRLFTKRERYNPKYPLSTWLFTITANLCKNHARWAKRHPEESWENTTSNDPDAPTLEQKTACSLPLPTDQAEKNERNILLRESIENLPHDLKVTLLLHYYEGLSYHDISVISNCSIRGVETRLYRARKLLKSSCEAIIR